MIQTTIKVQYDNSRVNTEKAIMRLEVIKISVSDTSFKYEINHFAIVDEVSGAKALIAASYKELSKDDYNQLSAAVDSVIQGFDISELTAFEIEYLRLKIGLLLYVKNDFIKDQNGDNTEFVVWGVLPTQYELV